MPITFDADTHTYTLDGRKVPSVTQILNDVIQPHYGGDAAYNMAHGSALHAGYAILGRGGEIGECDDDQRPYYDAWRTWADFYKVKVLQVETVVGSRLYQYAGTYDALVTINGQQYLIDYKATIIHELAGWQLAAYAIANDTPAIPRAAVSIDPNEPNCKARMVMYDGTKTCRQYNNEWLAILTAYRCRNIMRKQERK